MCFQNTHNALNIGTLPSVFSPFTRAIYAHSHAVLTIIEVVSPSSKRLIGPRRYSGRG